MPTNNHTPATLTLTPGKVDLAMLRRIQAELDHEESWLGYG